MNIKVRDRHLKPNMSEDELRAWIGRATDGPCSAWTILRRAIETAGQADAATRERIAVIMADWIDDIAAAPAPGWDPARGANWNGPAPDIQLSGYL